MDGSRVVIVKKKKVVKGGHHGGSWKVAYADFVTAMMAFFLVMWIMGMDQGVKDVVEGYFSNPVGFKKAFGGGTNPLSSGNSPVNMEMRAAALLLTRELQTQTLEETAGALEKAIQSGGGVADLEAEVEVAMTDEGLRIELMETGSENVFFGVASAQPRPSLIRLLEVVAAELGGGETPVVIEGHTDARPFRTSSGYSNWELSVDRANAARRLLVARGVEGARFLEVRGYADRDPKIRENPLDPRNRRISILLPFSEPIDLSDGSRIVPTESAAGSVTVVEGGSNGS